MHLDIAADRNSLAGFNQMFHLNFTELDGLVLVDRFSLSGRGRRLGIRIQVIDGGLVKLGEIRANSINEIHNNPFRSPPFGLERLSPAEG